MRDGTCQRQIGWAAAPVLSALRGHADSDGGVRLDHRGRSRPGNARRNTPAATTVARRPHDQLSWLRQADAQSLLRRPWQPGDRHLRAVSSELARSWRTPPDRTSTCLGPGLRRHFKQKTQRGDLVAWMIVSVGELRLSIQQLRFSGRSLIDARIQVDDVLTG